MRKLLGLDDSDDDSDAEKDQGEVGVDEDDDSFFGGGDNPFSDDSDDEGDGETKTFTFIPGKHNLEEKIRTKLKNKKEGGEDEKELTPWEKYQLKRKEKRKEKKRRAKEAKLKFQGKIPDNEEDSEAIDDVAAIDDLKPGKKKQNKATQRRAPSSKEELDLLLAGDDGKFCKFSIIFIDCLSFSIYKYIYLMLSKYCFR